MVKIDVRLPYEFDPNEANPDWSRAGRVHDWRNHVRDGAKEIWSTLTPAQRTALALDAEDAASDEEWD